MSWRAIGGERGTGGGLKRAFQGLGGQFFDIGMVAWGDRRVD
jgi:hypothetical protein